MSYGSGKFPVERASKLGHMKVIEHEHVRRLIRQFEQVDKSDETPLGFRSGQLKLDNPSTIRFVLTVDGGQALVPNEIRRDKRMAFIKFCAMLIRREDMAELQKNPVIDPRDMAKMFDGGLWYQAAALPLAGIRLPGETVKDTIRNTVDAVLEYTKLYEVLEFLVYHRWDPAYDTNPATNPQAPHMECVRCGETIYLPKGAFTFKCAACAHQHRLSDYLGIAQRIADDWAREEAAMNLRSALETLTVFHFLVRYWQKDPRILSQILFLKDGPLLLRAQLARLVEPIRSFIEMLKTHGVSLHLVGVEKNGELVDHIEEIKKHLPETGDFFLPSVEYLVEEVAGLNFDPAKYRNRVQYGSKVVIRLGPHHVIPMDVPTGDFKVTPTASDLIGFADTAAVLSEMLSFSYPNALVPLVLVNSYSSISQQPSGDILKAFAHHLFTGA